MDGNQDSSETEAFYQGEFEMNSFPVKVSYWKDEYLIAPSWFETETAARDYIEKIKNHVPVTFFMVQERHYVKGDPRIAVAKITGSIQNMNYYPHPSHGETQERDGEPMIDVWTMYFMGKELAEQYVTAFNAGVAAAINLAVQK
jgi:hypothetical protein